MKHLFSLCSVLVQLLNLIVKETICARNFIGHSIFISYNEPSPHYLPLNPHTVAAEIGVFQVISKAVLRLKQNQQKKGVSPMLKLSLRDC